MREQLKPGDQVCPPEQGVRYTILERVGNGASCMVYRAEYCNSQGEYETHLLKEYAPSQFAVNRAPGGVIKPADGVQDAFQAGMERFLAGAHNAIALRHRSGLQDCICEILRVFPANGTCYLDMPLSEGIVYAGVREFSLDSLLRRMIALTQAVGRIHRAGLLCLDLKPGNLLVRPEDPDHVTLFDLDSAVTKQGLSQGAKLYYSQAWAPPEQKLPSLYGEIGETADLYTIGELLFYQLLGRHSRPDACGLSAALGSQATPLLAGTGPETVRALGRVLCKAISTSPKKRYRRAGDLLEALDELLAIIIRERGTTGGGAAVLSPERGSVNSGSSSNPERDSSHLALMCTAIESGDYGAVRKSARLRRVRAETRFGRWSPKYLDAILHEAATCFAELAASLEDQEVPPSPLLAEFLQLLAEYLALAEASPSWARTHHGSLAAFADGLQYAVSLRLEQHQGGLSEEDHALLDMAMALARYAGDAQTLAGLREMACPAHKG